MTKAASIAPNKFTAKEILLFTASGIIILGGGFFLVRKIIRTAAEKKVEKNTLEEGTPEALAKSLKMAFENDGWPGTNMQEVRRIFQAIPTKEFFKTVQRKYQERYHKPLNSDLSSELQSSEYSEVTSILAAKPEKKMKAGALPVYDYLSWARRLKAAFDKTYGFMPGTDEAGIKAVFNEIPTQAAFLKLSEAYMNEYHTTLIEGLKSELEFWEYPEYMQIITSKPKS